MQSVKAKTGEETCQPRLARFISQLCLALCSLALVVMTVGISIEIVARNFFHYSIQSIEEVSSYLIVLVTFLAMVVAVYENALFRVELVLDRLSPSLRRWAEASFLLLFTGFLVIIDYQTIQLALGSYRGGYVAPSLLATPLYIPQMLIPFGVTLTLLIIIIKLWDLVRAHQTVSMNKQQKEQL